ncbi:FUSC family protein [Dactylosporangium sp. CA-092794]|uniref:FUSC family protein n=1 Tax=Dactylosporangium sp. CA-092794 TaxID=3239929 RepID=UPI003D91C258
MRNIWPAVAGFAPVLATVVTLAPIGGAAHTGVGIVVLGAAVSLMAGRSAQRHSPWRLLLVPVGAVVVAVFAVLFHAGHAYGDAFFVVAVAGATAARALGPAAGRFGRALVLPLIGMLIAPIDPTGHPLRTLAWATLAVFVAEAYVLLARLMPGTTAAEEPPSTAAPRIHVWRGVQSALALTLAFAAGQAFFGEHWPWLVISAYTVGAAARSRGEALLRGAHRTLGALGGTLVATAVAFAIGDRRPLAVVLLLVVLAAGFYLRQYAYAWWAASVTAALALLYSLLGTGATDALPLLALRLLGVVAGALCAILPATLLAPIRTGAVLRKRTAEALRAIRDGLSAGDLGPAERHIAALREAAAPLLAIRRFHRRRELDWVDALTGLRPDLRTLSARPDDRAALGRVRRVLGEVAADVRAASAEARGEPVTAGA